MPRRTRGRQPAAEHALAQRIQEERTRRKMSHAGLARRMEQAGCPIDQSALYKIEKGNPPRRITVDELVALARVFELSLDELLLPVADSRARAVATALGDLGKVRYTIDTILDEADRRMSALQPVLPLVADWTAVRDRAVAVAESLQALRHTLAEQSDLLRDALESRPS